MEFRSVFIAVVIGGALIVAAFVLNAQRPESELAYPSPEFIRASGK